MKGVNYKELGNLFIEEQQDGTKVHIIISQNDYRDIIIAKQLTKYVGNKTIQHIVKFPIKVNKNKFKELAEMLKNISEKLD